MDDPLVFINYEIAHGIDVHSAKSLHEIMNVTLMSGRDSSGGAALRWAPAAPRWGGGVQCPAVACGGAPRFPHIYG